MLVISTVLLTILTQYLLDTDALLYNSLSDQIAEEQVNAILENGQKWRWLGYIILPLILLLKISLISITLYAGAFLFDKKIAYKRLFLIVTKAEYIFLIVALIKLVWFVVQQEYTLEDVQYFYPLSALNIVGYEGLSTWFIYPFQTLNLFELAYWIILAWLIGKEIKITIDKALGLVASSYGSGLLIWIVAVMFFTLNAS